MSVDTPMSQSNKDERHALPWEGGNRRAVGDGRPAQKGDGILAFLQAGLQHAAPK